MRLKPKESSRLQHIGSFLTAARRERRLNQAELAARCALSQEQISYFERDQRRPNLDQLLRIAKALDSSIQKVVTGSDRPGTRLPDIAIELRHLGIADLWVADAVVPGAFRPPEEVIAHAASGAEPDPRILEAIPAVLAWNDLDPVLLRTYSLRTVPRTTRRLAWLADIALAIVRRGTFPGGCKTEQLARFIKIVQAKTPRSERWDNLGHSTTRPATSPIWKRWKINYDSDLATFEQRARHLHELRSPVSANRTKSVRHDSAFHKNMQDGATRKSAVATTDSPPSAPTSIRMRFNVARPRSNRRKKSGGGKRDAGG